MSIQYSESSPESALYRESDARLHYLHKFGYNAMYNP